MNLHFKLLVTLSILFSTVFCSYAQNGYYSGFDSKKERNGWKQYRLQTQGEFNEWDYVDLNSFSEPSCLYHNYPVGGQSITDDWFVSPPIDLTNPGIIDSIRYRFSGFGTPQMGDTVAIYVVVGDQDPSKGTPILLYDFRGNDYVADAIWKVLTDITIPDVGEKCFLAFRYHTINNWLDVRFDNISINSPILASSSSFHSSHQQSISIYPNPSFGQLTIKHDHMEYGEIMVYDSQGMLVFHDSIEFNTPINMNLPPAIYSYKVRTDNNSFTGRFSIVF